MGEGVSMKESSSIVFTKKNKVSAVNVSIWSILWNYICWVLAGKPERWEV